MYAENVRSNIPKSQVFLRAGTPSLVSRKNASLHYHDELELLYVTSGRMCCTVDGTDYYAGAGEIIFIRSGIPHQTSSIAGTATTLLQFKESNFIGTDFYRIIKYSVRLRDLSEEPVRVLRSEELAREITEMVKEQERGERSYEMFIRGSVFKIIGLLYRLEILSEAEKMYDNEKTEKILPVLSYVNERYNEDISLDQASSMLGFDQSYFCRIFKAATGATFTEYLNFVRICKAEKLLGKTSLGILNIAGEVGFSSVSYFNRIFKKYKSCSPSHYRSAKYCKNI